MKHFPTIAIQGEVGSYHQIAAEQFFGTGISLVHCRGFEDVFLALRQKKADQAVIAIENSVFGSINTVYDLVERYGYPIVGEVKIRIAHQLIALPGARLAGIKKVYSQDVALAQCSHFLATLDGVEDVEYYDTAAAARMVCESGDPRLAAIASRRAAELYGGHIVAADIENNDQNYTRFLVLDPSGGPVPGADKASLIITTDHQPGALYAALGEFASRGINLVKLQSQPIAGKPWHYKFYCVVEAPGPLLHDATLAITNKGYKLQNLGEYKRAQAETRNLGQGNG